MSSGRIPIVVIAAVARNGVIGAENRLLWRLSSDLKHFKALTMGKPLVMGRKTFQSIGKALPGRETIVVTRNPRFQAEGARIARSLQEGLEIAGQCAGAMGATEIVVAGGGEIYAQAMGIADRLIITHVDLEPAGDAVFPAIDPALWRLASEERPHKGEMDEASFRFAIYERR